MAKRILITGICGFVGSVLAAALREHLVDVELWGIDNFSRLGSETNREPLTRLGVHVVRGDIRMAAHLEQFPSVDWVIDAAANPSVLAGVDGATSSRELFDHNLLGTINLLEFCKQRGAGFILLSTSRVYSIKPLATLPVGERQGAFELVDDHPLLGVSRAGISERFPTDPPLSLYGTSKRCSEIVALEYGEAFDFPVWINRCGVLAGAGQFARADQGIFSFWIHAWARRRALAYIGFGANGYQVRDCLHPRDILPVVIQQMAAGLSSETPRLVNLAGGVKNSMSLAQLTRWCQERLGPHIISHDGKSRPFDLPWIVLDCSLAEHAWRWRPSTPLETILEEIANHAEANPWWLELTAK